MASRPAFPPPITSLECSHPWRTSLPISQLASSPANLGRSAGLVASTSQPDGRQRQSGEVEPVELHDLGPCGNEVADELLPRIAACVDLGERAHLRVRAEDQVDRGGGPLHLAMGGIADLVHVLLRLGSLPLRTR